MKLYKKEVKFYWIAYGGQGFCDKIHEVSDWLPEDDSKAVELSADKNLRHYTRFIPVN